MHDLASLTETWHVGVLYWQHTIISPIGYSWYSKGMIVTIHSFLTSFFKALGWMVNNAWSWFARQLIHNPTCTLWVYQHATYHVVRPSHTKLDLRTRLKFFISDRYCVQNVHTCLEKGQLQQVLIKQLLGRTYGKCGVIFWLIRLFIL